METRTQQAMSPDLEKRLTGSGVIAMLVIDELKHAVPLARALLKGGVDIIELTLRTPAALASGKMIRKEVPEITLGFGTVLTMDQVKAAKDAGADFAVAPGCNPKVIAEAQKCNLSFAPGIMTPSDIEMAVEHGCHILKFFPAEPSGGMRYLKSMASPYQHLGLKFIPLGGCNLENAETYLASPLTIAIGGSWIAERSLIQTENWDTIADNARAIRTLINRTRSKQ